MKFCYLKKEQVCRDCYNPILKGDEAVIILCTVQNGLKLPSVFHPQCFINWNTEMFMHRYRKWKTESMPKQIKKSKPKLGRPRKYINYVKASRLQSLICYHRKAGNEDKVRDLTKKLDSLRIKEVGVVTE